MFVIQSTVLEEMPPFPERESSLLAKLKKKKGGAALVGKEKEEEAAPNGPSEQHHVSPPPTTTTSPIRVRPKLLQLVFAKYFVIFQQVYFMEDLY